MWRRLKERWRETPLRPPSTEEAAPELTPAAHFLQGMFADKENNLLRDLKHHPEAYNQIVDIIENELNVSINELTYLADGSTAIALEMPGNKIVKLSRPTKGDNVIEELHKSKDLLLLPIISHVFDLPMGQGETPVREQAKGKVEIYPRIITRKEMSALQAATDPFFDAEAFYKQFDGYKLLLNTAFIKDGYLNSDLNNGNIGFLMEQDGTPVKVTLKSGEEHFVPVVIDYEKIGKIIYEPELYQEDRELYEEVMERYQKIKDAPLPEIVEKWQEANIRIRALHATQLPAPSLWTDRVQEAGDPSGPYL